MTDPKQIAETVARLRAKDVPLLESGAFRETRACIREAADLLQSLAAENAALKAEAEAAAARLVEARVVLQSWVSAIDEMVAFEAANPNDSTKAWSQRLDALEAAEETARAYLTTETPT